MSHELIHVHQQYNAVQAQLQELRARHEEKSRQLENQIAWFKMEHSQLQQKIASLHSEADLNIRYQNNLQSTLTNLQQQLAAAQDEKQALQAQVNALTARLQTIRTSLWQVTLMAA